MNEQSNNPKMEKKTETAMFDHEKLDVYHLELRFIEWVTPLLEEVAQNAIGKTARSSRPNGPRQSLRPA